MNTDTSAGRTVAEVGRRTNETYRLTINPDKDRMAYTVIVGLLARKPDKKTKQANMIMLNRHDETLRWLRRLTPEQLERAAPEISKSIKVVLDLNQLKNAKKSCEHLAKLRNMQLEQCRWMIQNNARNNMIMSICFLVAESEIRQIRAELGIPAQMGRVVVLPIEEQLTVQQVWQELLAQEPDEFRRYRRLQEAFPQYDLGRLNAAINGI